MIQILNEEKGLESRKLPTISVGWDEQRQIPVVKFETDEFKSFGFLEAVLIMAAEDAKFRGNIAKMQTIQQHALAQAQHDAMHRKIIGG